MQIRGQTHPILEHHYHTPEHVLQLHFYGTTRWNRVGIDPLAFQDNNWKRQQVNSAVTRCSTRARTARLHHYGLSTSSTSTRATRAGSRTILATEIAKTKESTTTCDHHYTAILLYTTILYTARKNVRNAMSVM